MSTSTSNATSRPALQPLTRPALQREGDKAAQQAAVVVQGAARDLCQPGAQQGRQVLYLRPDAADAEPHALFNRHAQPHFGCKRHFVALKARCARGQSVAVAAAPASAHIVQHGGLQQAQRVAAGVGRLGGVE